MNKISSAKSILIEFFYGEYFNDALRNTLCVVLPIVVFFMLNQTQVGIGVGLGALVISLTDLPGHKRDKAKSGMLSVGLFFITTLLIGFSLSNQWFTAFCIFTLTFLFSMMAAFGNRESVIGTMCIILAVFVLGLRPPDYLFFSLMVMTGGIWYYAVSLTQMAFRPFRSTHQAIHECLSATADFLSTKAKFYDPSINLEECYQETIFQHQQVFEKQELIRNLLLTDRSAMNPDNFKGRRLLAIVNSVILLYEQVTAIHYNYDDLRKRFEGTGVLETLSTLIECLAADLDKLSVIYLQRSRRSVPPNQQYLVLLKELDEVSTSFIEEDRSMLLNIKLNIQEVGNYIHQVNDGEQTERLTSIRFSDFVPLPPTWRSVMRQFTFRSPIVRFSLRLALLCLTACLISFIFPQAKYSYWVLLTVVVIAKPRFSVSWNRNLQRLAGTFAGVVLGMLLLLLLKNAVVLLTISALMLLGFFAFNRPRYALSVFCITPCALITLSILQGYSNEILLERTLFTVVGCAIAFAAAYLFPIWESNSLKSILLELLEGNRQYLETVLAGKQGLKQPEIIFISPKLARKRADNSLARFSETIQHILQEPQVSKLNIQMLYEIQVISYRINAMTTALSLSSIDYGIGDQLDNYARLALENIEFSRDNAQLFDPGNMECLPAKGSEDAKNLVETIFALSMQLRAIVTKS